MAKFSSPRQFGGEGDWRSALRSNWQYLTAWLNGLQKITTVDLDSNLVLTTGTVTVVAWDGLRGDDELRAWSSANPSRLTVIAAGRYQALVQVTFQSNATNWRQASIHKNGSGTAIVNSRIPAVSGQDTQTQATLPPTDLKAGDYLEVRVTQNSGGNLNLEAVTPTFFCMWRVG